MNIVRLRKKTPKFLFIPLIILLAFAIYSGHNKREKRVAYETTKRYMQFTAPAEKLIHNLQIERGYTSAYLAASDESFANKLQEQRKITNNKIIKLKEFIQQKECKHSAKKEIVKFFDSLERLPKIRENVDKFSNNNEIKFYTQEITQLINLIRDIIPLSQDDGLVNLTQSYIAVIEMKEYAGQERALVSKIFAKGEINHKEFYELGVLNAAQKVYFELFRTVAQAKHLALFKTKYAQKSMQDVKKAKAQIYSKSERNELLSDMKEYVGYGGLIHNFKNYVIRGKKKYERAVKKDYQNLVEVIKKYKALEGTTKEEIVQLDIIQNTFLTYLHNIQAITKAYSKKHTNIHLLDTIVKVDDTPALKSLNHLTKNIYGSTSVWFDIASTRINVYQSIEFAIAEDINIFIDKQITILNMQVVANIIILIVIFVLIASAIIVLREIIESGKMLNRAQENTRSGSYEYYLDEDLLFWSDEYYKLLEVDKEQFEPSMLKFMEFIHEDDLQEVKKSVFESIKTKKIIFIEYRIVLQNKKVFVVRSSFEVIKYDSSGKAKIIVGTMTDISESKALEQEIVDTQKDVILTMGAIGETRSKETGHHVRRVAEYSRLLALLCGESEERADLLKMASPMHDIGKVAIADSILNKPGKLTPEEWSVMKTHAQLGYEMLRHSQREILKLAATVALTHHEYYDGNGYPHGLKEKEIPLVGRITTLADVFDALGSDRCYKKAWEIERTVKYITDQRGKMFDPLLVDMFLENIDQFLEIRDMYKDSEFNEY